MEGMEVRKKRDRGHRTFVVSHRVVAQQLDAKGRFSGSHTLVPEAVRLVLCPCTCMDDGGKYDYMG